MMCAEDGGEAAPSVSCQADLLAQGKALAPCLLVTFPGACLALEPASAAMFAVPLAVPLMAPFKGNSAGRVASVGQLQLGAQPC